MPVEVHELCWFNGEILPLKDVRISPEDRGFQFGDGVYEAVRIYNGVPFAIEPHLDRLENSARGLRLTIPIARDLLATEMTKLIAQSNLRDGLIYLQLTRGESKRSHVIPATIKSTLLFYVRPIPPATPIDQQLGASIVSVLDERWRKCWIKVISLAASVLARFEAGAKNADEAVFVDEHGIVAECTSSNIFAVIDGVLVTHPVGARVLPGITRNAVIDCAKRADIRVVERPIHIDEAKNCGEVFITLTTRQVVWVKQWDEKMIAKQSGETTRKLAKELDAIIAQECHSFSR